MCKTLRILAGMILCASCMLASAVFHAADGEMEAGAIYRYQVPTLDVDEFDPGHGYGFLFRYWLNDTSTIDLELEDRFHYWEIDGSEGTEDMEFRFTTVSGSLVYLPKLDFIGRPALGLGLGYMNWNADSDLTKAEEGQGWLFFASAGLEFRLWDFVTVAPLLRFQYFPFDHKFVSRISEVEVAGETVTEEDKTSFAHAGMFSAGINLTFLLK